MTDVDTEHADDDVKLAESPSSESSHENPGMFYKCACSGDQIYANTINMFV